MYFGIDPMLLSNGSVLHFFNHAAEYYYLKDRSSVDGSSENVLVIVGCIMLQGKLFDNTAGTNMITVKGV